MKTIVIASALLAATTTIALSQPIQQANPYPACIAEAQASGQFDTLMTIDNLRQYMAEHPDCRYAVVQPPIATAPKLSQEPQINRSAIDAYFDQVRKIEAERRRECWLEKGRNCMRDSRW